MDNQVHNQIVSFIWGIADDCLRDVYVRGKYRDVILPMTVIRRLDAMLEETKPAVLAMKKQLDAAKIDNQWPALCNAAGQAFCNASPFLLKDLTSRSKAQTLKADFKAYLDGFSPNVQVILDKFKFRNQIDTMVDADILGAVIEKFTSSDINLSPNPIYKDEAKTILKHPGLDNHGMGTIFEELIRKFNEENNEEAGEHWTPRDVVELMADLVFMPIADKIKDASYSCYDGACGTGGMLTVAQDRLLTLAKRRGKEVAIHLFGQEINPETYAICTADMLLKGDGEEAEHIMYGSTLSDDQHASRQFDFMLSNPPYGKSWKTDAEKMGGKKEILDTRFNTYLEGGELMPMIPRTSDGQLLFLLNNVSKMKKDTELGSRIVEVHNGSSIFTGDAGSGESNARRYLIENDLVEAIIALPDKMFYKQLELDDQIKFKSAAKSFVRTYGFLGAILPYGNVDWEKLSIFLNLLILKLPSPRDDDLSEGILQTIDLSSYRNEAQEAIAIKLEDADAEIAPVPAGKVGHIVEPEMDLLSKIIMDFNDMFGNINWNDADNVQRQILAIPEMVSKDKKYQNAMKNSDAQEARTESERALQAVIFSIMADNMELFKQFQDNPSFKKWLSDLVFNLTYNPEGKEYVMPGAEQKSVTYDFNPQQDLMMVAEDPAPYGEKKDDD